MGKFFKFFGEDYEAKFRLPTRWKRKEEDMVFWKIERLKEGDTKAVKKEERRYGYIPTRKEFKEKWKGTDWQGKKEISRKEKWISLIEKEDKKIKEIEKAVKEKKPEKLDKFLKVPDDKHLFFDFKSQKDDWL